MTIRQDTNAWKARVQAFQKVATAMEADVHKLSMLDLVQESVLVLEGTWKTLEAAYDSLVLRHPDPEEEPEGEGSDEAGLDGSYASCRDWLDKAVHAQYRCRSELTKRTAELKKAAREAAGGQTDAEMAAQRADKLAEKRLKV